MNFNLDDPLGDLLSDNSNDNDSFFENQPGRRKTASKSPATKPGGGKGKMEDLFGIKEESEPQFKVPPIRATLSGGVKAEKPLATSTPKVKAKNEETDDILSDLGFDPKKPKTPLTAKSNLFDDILGPLETKKPSTAPSSKMEELSVRRDDVTSTRGTISRQSTDTTENSAILGQPRPKTSVGRRSSITSPAKNNPLNLFSTSKEKEAPRVSTPKEKEPPRVPTPKVQKRGTTADWLGLGTEPAKEPETPKRSETPPPKVEISKNEGAVEFQTFTMPTPTPEAVSSITMAPGNPLPFLMTSSNLGAENAAQLIQQQESQISLATQMKNQELALLDMQKRQHELLSRQEIQFKDLLQRQIARQNQIEQSIKAQQDRINAHIQLLMTQPASVSFPTKDDNPDEEKNDDSPKREAEFIKLEGEVKRLEVEKLRLEDLVSNINANYEKEIEMIEKSFRKQIKVLEDHLASVEARLLGEIETLHKFYTDKLKSSDDDKLEIRTRLEANLTALKDSHDEEIRRLKKTHEEDLDALQDDHRRMLETIRQSKLLEFAVVQENGSYLETLRLASNNLETVSGDLQTLRTEMERKLDILHKDRENKLELREKKLEDSERRLKMVEESAEEEKQRLMGLVGSLESQLIKLSKDSSEENWILRQKMASLEAEKKTFEKEKELSREQISKDEKRIEELKEYQLSETQRQMQLIQEERTQLNVEKAKFETAKKLESNSDLERSRQEIEAALQVAHDATRQAELERERFFKLQRQLETQKRDLMEKETIIRSREEELEQDVALARTNERRAHEAAQKARLSEQNFNEKIIFLQQKMRDLSEKESRLSQERLSLSQERIELQNLKSKLEQNRCSLCRIGERNTELSHVLRPNDGVNGIPVIDDHQFTVMQSSSAVDQLLDANIAESLERMKETTSRHWDEFERNATETKGLSGNVDSKHVFDPSGDFLRNL